MALALLILLPLPAQAQVFRGRVLDRESGQPVLIAAVLLVDYYYIVRTVGMTDSVGRYELRAPGPGRYKVRADARGYQPVYTGEYIVEAGDTVEVDVLVTYDPGGGEAPEAGRVLEPGRMPPGAHGTDEPAATCDGRWIVEVANRFAETIKVYDGHGEERVHLGNVPAGRLRGFPVERPDRPEVTVGPHEDFFPRDFRERSQGLIEVRVYCESRPGRTPLGG